MPARNSQPVRYLVDDEAVPPRRQEVITRTASALAFWHGGKYDPARPDHGDGALLTATWGVIPHHAPADAVPEFVHYDRADPRPFRVGGEHYVQLGDAMEAAVAGGPGDTGCTGLVADPDGPGLG